MTCYITAYYDIGRENWPSFRRTFDQYLKSFLPFIDLFDNDTDDELLVFIDKRYIDNLVPIIKKNIKLISIDETFMNKLHCWKTLEVERNIMFDPNFRKLISGREQFPECNYPEYNLLNHCKIDIIVYAIVNEFSTNNTYAWVDFGFFSRPDNIPSSLLDTSRFDLSRINYCLVNPISLVYDDVYYVLKNAPEVIGGFFFLGEKERMIEYQRLYHSVLEEFQKLRICDDDQHIVLQCYFKHKDLFSFDSVLGWHKVFLSNPKSV